jgi:tripartite-type tricarboxylate transporter receptor subunit TctC
MIRSLRWNSLMSSPEDFVVFLRGEIAKWTKVVREANLRIE